MFFGLVLLAFDAQSATSKDIPTPFQDVVQLCTHDTGGRAEVAQKFLIRGWKKLEKPLPNRLGPLLADGELITALYDPQAASVEVDTKSGALPDMTDPLAILLSSVNRGAFDALWRDGEDFAFLLISDGNSDRENLRCRLYSSTMQGASALIAASLEYHNGDVAREYGPVRSLTEYFRGFAAHQPFTGMPGLFVKLNLLVDRPILEPQIGAGKSTITLNYLDAEGFVSRFNRVPHSSYVLWVSRTPKIEVTP